MKNRSVFSFFAGSIGHALKYYDTALFGLLAPFLAPLFFDKDPLTALILTYAILPLGAVARPVVALFFGWMGDRVGRKRVLFFSLFGMGIATIFMGCLPTYAQVGGLAPLLLALGRTAQSFFAGGESSVSAVFVLEDRAPSQRNLASGFYNAVAFVGILTASGLVALFSRQGWIEEGWRLLFWMGGLAAAWGLFVRRKGQEEERRVVQGIDRGALFSIAVASGFSYVTYAMAFTLMNGYVPLVTSLTKSEVVQVNTALLVIDMAFLPCFGYLAHRIGRVPVMLGGALLSAVGAIPLFACLEDATLSVVVAVRCTIVFFGVAFGAPYQAWALEQVAPERRCRTISLGQALGSQLIGAPTAAIALWLYQQTGYVWAPGLYFSVVACGALYVLRSRALSPVRLHSI